MSAEFDAWQVWSEGTVYEADFETLKQWILEGCVLPTDKVRRGNLRWIEAGRAPALRAIFNGEEQAQQPPSQSDQTHFSQQDSHQSFTQPSHQPFQPQQTFPSQPAQQSFQQPQIQTHTEQPHFAPDAYAPAEDFTAQTQAEPQLVDFESAPPPPPVAPAILAGAAVCYNHGGMQPKFICRMCSATFCHECPKYVGSTKVPVCPLCGDLCKPYEQIQQKVVRQQLRTSGFGFMDLGQAFGYPFKHFWSLVGGSILYSILMFGGFKGQILGSAILLGSLCMVIKHAAWGRIDRPFLPDISAFSLWDDLFVPLGLSIGIYAITLGPMILLIVITYVAWFRGPHPVVLGPTEAAQQQQQITPQDIADLDRNDPEAVGRAEQKIDRNRPVNQINSAVERVDNAERDSAIVAFRSFLMMLAAVPGWMWLLISLSVLWAIFYFPMALSIAGFTEDFWSVVNPLLGLSTMRDMGFVYVKVFFMYLAIQFIQVVVLVVINLILSPFDMPIMGNIPARFIGNTISYYFSLVIACVLGLALYKCADKLEIQTD